MTLAWVMAELHIRGNLQAFEECPNPIGLPRTMFAG
jgi:hypothetical protein